MATSERADRSTLQTFIALAGAATAIVIVVYLVGGAIVWERLHVLRLPANNAVAPLPRNFLLINGVRALAWPVALGLIAGSSVILLTRIFRFGVRVVRSTWVTLLVVWVGALVVIPIIDTGPKGQHLVFVTTVGVLVALGVAIVHRQPLAVRRVALSVALAVAAIVVVVEAVDIWTLPVRMEYAHVWLANGKESKGFYIGATSDAVYLAPNKKCHVGSRIVSLPQRRINRIIVFTSIKAWSKHSDPHDPHDCVSPP